jgi:hypothetical protein
MTSQRCLHTVITVYAVQVRPVPLRLGAKVVAQRDKCLHFMDGDATPPDPVPGAPEPMVPRPPMVRQLQ